MAISELHWFTAVLSAPRNPPTLEVTLASLARAGFYDPIIFHDGERRGPMLNFMRALDSAIRLAEVARPAVRPDWLLICEDDVELTPGLRYHIPLPPKAWNSVLSLYCSVQTAEWLEDLPHPGWHTIIPPVNARGQGALAYAMTLSVARQLRWHPFDWSRCIGADHWVPVVCQKASIPFMVHSPSFVLHTGRTSSLRRPVGDDRFRQCKSFVSRFDDHDHGEILPSAVVSGDGRSFGGSSSVSSISSITSESSEYCDPCDPCNPGFPARSIC